jgi:CheY-like chemotaxis protein
VTTPSQPILLVEDSPEDFEATERALRKAGLKNPIYRCADGEEALDFLHRRGSYADAADAPRPGIVLLDLNLPGTDGREVLSEIKTDPALKQIPVVVLTTSSDQRDIDVCYRSGANSYIQKPERLHGYWLEVVILPMGE